MKLRVYRGDWFFNMGIVGFLNIIKKADKQAEIFIMKIISNLIAYFLKTFMSIILITLWMNMMYQKELKTILITVQVLLNLSLIESKIELRKLKIV